MTRPMQLDGLDVLLIIDVQNDFLPGGALAVSHADSVVPILNRYIELFSNNVQIAVDVRELAKKVDAHIE